MKSIHEYLMEFLVGKTIVIYAARVNGQILVRTYDSELTIKKIEAIILYAHINAYDYDRVDVELELDLNISMTNLLQLPDNKLFINLHENIQLIF